MAITLDLQIACENANLPSKKEFQAWLDCALTQYNKPFEVTVRIVDESESQALNLQYRQKNKSTNVLSFPFEVPDGIDMDLLGDLVVCATVVELEAKEQNKPLNHHWAHMIIHGCLHLLGFDHITEEEAQEMETLEINLLNKLSIPDPYQID